MVGHNDGVTSSDGEVVDHRGRATGGATARYHKCYWS
jgi:hypothetical protein